MTKSNLGNETFVSFYTFQFIAKEAKVGFQGRNLGARTEAETMVEQCLLTCVPRLAQPAFLYNPEPPAHGVVAPTVGWALPHKLLLKDAHRLPTGQSDGDIFSVEVPSS